MKLSDLRNGEKPIRIPRVNFALCSKDSSATGSHGVHKGTSRQLRGKKIRSSFQVLNQSQRIPSSYVTASESTTSYCCFPDTSKNDICAPHTISNVDDTTENETTDDAMKMTKEEVEEDAIEREKLEAEESNDSASDLKSNSDELQTRVIGCKFEFTYRLPQLCQVLGLRRMRNHSRTNCLKRCLVCKRKRRNSRIMDQPETSKSSEVAINISKSNVKTNKKESIQTGKIDDFEPKGSEIDNIYQQQSTTFPINLLMQDQNQQSWEKAKRHLVFNNVGLERRRGGGSGDTKVNGDTRRCASVSNTKINPVVIKKLLDLDNMLYCKRSERLHVLYNNANYKVLQSFTSAVSSFNDIAKNEFNIKPQYSSYSNKTYRTCLDTVDSNTKSSVLCNEINYEDALEDVNAELDMPEQKASQPLGAPRLSKTLYQAVFPSNSSSFKQTNVMPIAVKESAPAVTRSEKAASEFSMRESPPYSDIDVTEKEINNYMDNIYDTSSAISKLSGDDTTTVKTLKFEKVPPMLHTDNATFIRIFVYVSAAYERLQNIEKRIKRLMVDLGIDCEAFGIKPDEPYSPRTSLQPQQVIPKDYQRINYTITRDPNDQNVMYINPPTDLTFKTCECNANMDCMKIDFAEKFDFTETCETCKTCMQEYTVLVEELRHKHDDKNTGIFKKLCNIFVSMLPIEPAECIYSEDDMFKASTLTQLK